MQNPRHDTSAKLKPPTTLFMPDLNNYIFYFPYRMCTIILPPRCYVEHLETTVYWLIFKTWSLQDDLGPMTNDFSEWIDLPNETIQVCILPWSDCTLSFISMSISTNAAIETWEHLHQPWYLYILTYYLFCHCPPVCLGATYDLHLKKTIQPSL